MFNAEMYMQDLIAALQTAFGDRLIYVGLQGSYMRGEATETSDIDPMVVIDGLTAADLAAYRSLIQNLPSPELSCGFLCGRQDLAHWNALEMSHLLHTTRDEYGELAPLLPAYDKRDICSFIQMSIGNLYHELCHRCIHASSEHNRECLPSSCKGVFFILQNLHHLRTGTFCVTKQELLAQLEGNDLVVMNLCLELAKAETFSFDSAFETLLGWCQETLASLPVF